MPLIATPPLLRIVIDAEPDPDTIAEQPLKEAAELMRLASCEHAEAYLERAVRSVRRGPAAAQRSTAAAPQVQAAPRPREPGEGPAIALRGAPKAGAVMAGAGPDPLRLSVAAPPGKSATEALVEIAGSSRQTVWRADTELGERTRHRRKFASHWYVTHCRAGGPRRMLHCGLLLHRECGLVHRCDLRGDRAKHDGLPKGSEWAGAPCFVSNPW